MLSSVRITGGAFTGVGDVIGSTGSEGNFHYDPQAAHIVITVSHSLYRITPISISTPLKSPLKLHGSPISKNSYKKMNQEVTLF